jgi:hypothetical protein
MGRGVGRGRCRRCEDQGSGWGRLVVDMMGSEAVAGTIWFRGDEEFRSLNRRVWVIHTGIRIRARDFKSGSAGEISH